MRHALSRMFSRARVPSCCQLFMHYFVMSKCTPQPYHKVVPVFQQGPSVPASSCRQSGQRCPRNPWETRPCHWQNLTGRQSTRFEMIFVHSAQQVPRRLHGMPSRQLPVRVFRLNCAIAHLQMPEVANPGQRTEIW